MEIKINFNKLFDIDNQSSHTPSTTSLQNSYQFDEPSIISASSNHVDLHYKFNEALFFDSSLIQQNDHNINILEDISSIGRSFDDSYEKQARHKETKKSLKQPSNYQKQQQLPFGQQTFYLNQKSQKAPGQRLYYEHKVNEQRKLRELQRMRMQKEEQQQKQTTFKPAINENSKKILELAQSPLSKLNNLKKSQKQIQKQTQNQPVKSTVQRKQEEQMKNCTFQPVLIKTPKNKLTSNTFGEQRPANKVFEQLYNEHKSKDLRRQKALQELSKRQQKKMTKEQLQQFLQRNEEYMQQKQHKEELMRAVSAQYDLSSGRKLFEPKINQTSQTMFNATMSLRKLIQSPSSKKAQLIRQMSSEHQQESLLSPSKRLLKGDKSRSGKSGRSQSNKSKSNSKRVNPKGNELKKQIQGNDSVTYNNKKAQKAKNVSGGKPHQKKFQTVENKTNITEFKPLPYQVTKVPQLKSDNHNQFEMYPKTNSGIFNKIKATLSLFQEQQEPQQNDERQQYDSQQENQMNEEREYDDVEGGEQYQQKNQQQHQENYGQQVDYQQSEGQDLEESIRQDQNDAEPQRHISYLSNVNQSHYNLSQDNASHLHQMGLVNESNQENEIDLVPVSQNQIHDNYDHEYFDQSNQNQITPSSEHIETSEVVEQNHRQQQQYHYSSRQHQQLDHQQTNYLSASVQPEAQQEQMKSSLLKSISANPKINQKYQNLFDLQAQNNQSEIQSSLQTDLLKHQRSYQGGNNIDSQTKFENNHTKKSDDKEVHNMKMIRNLINVPSEEFDSDKEEEQNDDIGKQKMLQHNGQPSNSIGMNLIDKDFDDAHNFNANPTLHDAQDHSRQPSQRVSSKKSWQHIFNSSTNFQSQQQHQTDPPYQESIKTKQSRLSLDEPPTQESPKKKPINIASLLKAKRKPSVRRDITAMGSSQHQ